MQRWWLIKLYLYSPNVGPHFCPAPQTLSMSNKAPCAALLLYYKACIWISQKFGTTPSNVYLSHARTGATIIKMVFPVLPALSPRFHVKKEAPVTSLWLSTSTNFSSQSDEMLKRFLIKACAPQSLLCCHGGIVTGPEGTVKWGKVRNRLWERTGNK